MKYLYIVAAAGTGKKAETRCGGKDCFLEIW